MDSPGAGLIKIPFRSEHDLLAHSSTVRVGNCTPSSLGLQAHHPAIVYILILAHVAILSSALLKNFSLAAEALVPGPGQASNVGHHPKTDLAQSLSLGHRVACPTNLLETSSPR